MRHDEAEALYRSEGAKLERALTGSFGDPMLAGDATSQAFIELLAHRGSVEVPRAWVWKTAFAIARGISSARSAPYGLWPPDAGVTDTPAPVDLVDALAVLSPLQRQTVVLHHYAGWPVRDVARIVSSTPSAVKVHLFRGRARLRELMHDEEVHADG